MDEDRPPIPSYEEDVLEPDLPICDSHHHLWPLPLWGRQYLIEDFLADTTTGHKIESSVYVECMQAYYESGPERFRPVGETASAAEAARSSGDRGKTEIVGIVGYADLRQGEGVKNVLDRHIEAGQGLFRGVRHATAWDKDPLIGASHSGSTPGLMGEPGFRRGLAVLADRGLVFDSWLYHPQLGELTDAARALPALRVVVDHLGGPLAVGLYSDSESVLSDWKRGIADLSTCPNVYMKLGGIGMPLIEHTWPNRPSTPSSSDIATQWQERVDFCIELFGADRCMFESNFPVDGQSFPYVVLWNAFKLMTKDRSVSERRRLFRDTARHVYSLESAN